MEIITVKNVDEVLKVALTKPLKRVEWGEVDQISKKGGKIFYQKVLKVLIIIVFTILKK